MKWRIIIRMSFDQDRGSKLRNPLDKLLSECGIRFAKATGNWEGKSISAIEAATQLRKLMEHLADHIRTHPHSQRHLDHLWIYIDRAKPEQP